jgi:hypothetical protein
MTPDARRPIYGYLSTPDFHSVGNQSQERVAGYGEVVIRLKPSVRGRATMTLGDSLTRRDQVQAAPAEAPDLRMAPVQRPAWAGIHKLLHDRTGSAEQINEGLSANFAYFEAQFHGGLDVGDVAEVAFAVRPNAAVRAALHQREIPWRVIGPNPK